MLIDLKRHAAYMCPNCGRVTEEGFSAFSFSGRDRAALLCGDCDRVCAEITEKKGGYTIKVNCPVCGYVHEYTVPRGEFWNRELIALQCSADGTDVFFLGEQERVQEAAKGYEDVSARIKEYQSCGYDPRSPEGRRSILFEMVDCVNEFRSLRSLSCVCRSTEINLMVFDDKMTLACPRCGRTKTIEPTEENLARIIDAGEIILKD